MTSLILLSGLVVRVGVAVWNAHFGPSFGAELDALQFHEFAVDASAGLDDERAFSTGWIYPSLLGLIYRLTIPSLFVGGLLSCFAWLLSGIALIKICRVVAINESATVIVMGLYAFLPSSFLTTAVTLREAYQMLFVNLALLSGLHLLRRFRARYVLLFISSAYAAAWLHAALAAFGLMAAIIFLVAKMIHQRLRVGVLFVAIGSVIVAFTSVVMVSGYDPSFSLSELVTLFRAGTPDDARTNYPAPMVFNSNWDLITNLPLILLQYLFEPMPWRISGLADVYLFVENIGRLVLIVVAVRQTVLARPYRADLLALTGCYFAIEAIWAVGTVNWGTASRHHLPILGCLLVIGFVRNDRTALPQEANDVRTMERSNGRSASST